MKANKRTPSSALSWVRTVRISRNLAQATVTISVGIAFALATFLSGEAAAHSNRAVKEDVKRSAALIEDARYLFADEAPFAYEYAATVARADALVEAADGLPESEAGGALLESEAGGALLEAHVSRTSVSNRREDFLAAGDTLLEDEYWQGDHFDVASRLEDARAAARRHRGGPPRRRSHR